jgi:hypothetical protein
MRSPSVNSVSGIIASVGIETGFLLAYRSRKAQYGGAAVCATPANTRVMQAVRWLALILLLGAVVVP